MSLSFRRTLTVTASTSRTVLSSTGQSSGPTAVLSEIVVSEPTPISNDLRQRVVLDTPIDLLQTFCGDDMDVQNGDTLTLADSVVVTNKGYTVRHVERWQWRGAETFKVLALEDARI